MTSLQLARRCESCEKEIEDTKNIHIRLYCPRCEVLMEEFRQTMYKNRRFYQNPRYQAYKIGIITRMGKLIE